MTQLAGVGSRLNGGLDHDATWRQGSLHYRLTTLLVKWSPRWLHGPLRGCHGLRDRPREAWNRTSMRSMSLRRWPIPLSIVRFSTCSS
jgi:hypothetical protein